MGYASWGSNDGNWNKNYLPNSGFDTLDTSWQSGSRYWTHTSPTVAPEDDFNWSYQTDEKQGGNGAFKPVSVPIATKTEARACKAYTANILTTMASVSVPRACLPSSTETPTESKLSPTSTEVHPTTPTLALTVVSKAIGAHVQRVDRYSGYWKLDLFHQLRRRFRTLGQRRVPCNQLRHARHARTLGFGQPHRRAA